MLACRGRDGILGRTEAAPAGPGLASNGRCRPGRAFGAVRQTSLHLRTARQKTCETRGLAVTAVEIAVIAQPVAALVALGRIAVVAWGAFAPLTPPTRSPRPAPTKPPGKPSGRTSYGPVRHPAGPACPSRGPSWRMHATDRASRVATLPIFHACRRHDPGGTVRCSLRSLPGRWQPSPK